MSGQGTVLVTGGPGFIASWCVMGLLQQGYATVNPSMVVGPVLSRDFFRVRHGRGTPDVSGAV
jgi:nucleoside-diphosphate-sugar epimerase